MKKLLLLTTGLFCVNFSQGAIVAMKIGKKADQQGAIVTVAKCRISFAQWAEFQIDRFNGDLGLAAPLGMGLYGDQLVELKAGDVIDATGNYLQPKPMSTQSARHFTKGGKYTGGSYYFGLRGHVNDKVTDVRYGWIKITYNAMGDATVDSIAFNDQPDASIKAGQASSSSTTNVNDVTASVFSVYPNPVKGVMTVTAQNNMSVKEISIFNLAGQLVMQRENNAGGATVSISLDQLSNGSYFLQIRSREGKLEHHQFIKE